MEARPGRRAHDMLGYVRLWLLLVALFLALAVFFASRADAAYYKMVMCAGNNGVPGYGAATNTISGANPSGIFEFHNYCGGQGGDPPGENAFLRINENQASGNAGNGAYGDIYWDTPAYVHWKAAGGYTREAFQFNNGWRARFWVLDFANNGDQLLTQGVGLPNTGTQWNTTASFGPHLWPFGNYLDFHRLVFELECVRAEGCDRSGFNATDANGFVFILSDDSPSQVALSNTAAPLLAGEWVRGAQDVTWNSSDLGSGLRFERMRVDGASRFTLDYQAAGACNTASSQVNGEWARAFLACPDGGPYPRAVGLDTATLADGAHNLSVCTQDFGQYQGLGGTGGETCDQRTIRTDNTSPGAPAQLEVSSANPARYLSHFAAHWQLPPNEGSPIARVHYEVLAGAGKVAVPTQSVAGETIEAIADLETPEESGEYTLRLWLSDAEGNVGAPVGVPLAYDCPRSPVDGGTALSAGLGEGGTGSEVVQEGHGSALHGALRAAGGDAASNATLCVFSRVITDPEREFLGIALTSRGGGYRFAIAPGASRQLSVLYRPDHRELVSHATIETVVHPVLNAASRVVYNKHFAHFSGQIPGPDNNRVVVVLQAKVGKGWTAFRRYRTRANGRYSLAYRFRHTFRRTRYVMRAQVRQTVGYPYLQGNSRRLKLLVIPKPHRHR